MGVHESPAEQPTESTKDECVPFDPSKMIGIIKRKALIKDLAAAYHAECVAQCQELLQLQRKLEEQYKERRIIEDNRKEMMKPSKRPKKAL